jgi:hypothetical protein
MQIYFWRLQVLTCYCYNPTNRRGFDRLGYFPLNKIFIYSGCWPQTGEDMRRFKTRVLFVNS